MKLKLEYKKKLFSGILTQQCHERKKIGSIILEVVKVLKAK